MTITADILKQIAPGSSQTSYKLLQPLADEMNAQFEKGGIDTTEEYCHFIAQAAHETNSFNTLTEYGSGRQYENRRDLGNDFPGDGVKFKGRGIFQNSGRINYLQLSNVNPDRISFIDHPELLATPKWAVWSAIVYWNDKHLSDFANHSDTDLIFSKTLNKKLPPLDYISWRINGGFNGVEQRRIFYQRCKSIFN